MKVKLPSGVIAESNNPDVIAQWVEKGLEEVKQVKAPAKPKQPRKA